MKKRTRQLNKKIISILLCLTMVLPSMMKMITVQAAVTPDINGDENIQMLWSTSFEDDEDAMLGFQQSPVDEGGKGAYNVVGTYKESIPGDVTYLVDMDSIKGNADFNASEAKIKLFDGSTGTKYLTNTNVPVTVAWKLQDGVMKAVNNYSIFSANDAVERDPKNWEFQARNEDSEEWVTLDSQTDQVFEERLMEKNFDIDNDVEYNQYRLYITANSGRNQMTQLSEVIISTGNPDDNQPIIDHLYCGLSNGPVSTWNQASNQGWRGKRALRVAGAHIGEGEAHSYNVLFDNVNTLVEADTYLSYVIFPALFDENNYDFNYTQMHMMIDLKFTDGTYLSDLEAKDQNGNLLTPDAQGESKTLLTQQWNQIYSNIGKVAEGKTIEQVLSAYDKKDNPEGKLTNFTTYFDDIKIYNKEEKVYANLADYVYILRGTNDNSNFSRGLTAPVVTLPHGFNFWAPATNYNDNNIYNYQSTTMKYITISHEPSFWIGDRGTWQFMVNTSLNQNSTSFNLQNMNSDFSHDNETAHAHYYSVEFDKTKGNSAGAKLEMSPTDHGAAARFTFDDSVSNRNIIFDCVRGGSQITFAEDKMSFTSYTDHLSYGMKRMYIYGVFDQEPSRVSANGKQGIARFDNAETVELRMATSYISQEQAKYNLELEMGDKDFDQVFDEALDIWNEKLNVISDVKGGSEEQLISLYSNLYRLFSYPNSFSENTGTNEEPVWKYKSPYRAANAEPVPGLFYSNNGFWDTFRTSWPAYALLTPEKDTDLLNGLVQHYIDQTWIPRWIAPGGVNLMVGTSSDVIFGDALVKDVKFDVENAYASSLRNAASVSANLGTGGRKGTSTSVFNGYISGGGESLSWNMDGFVNDYGIAQMAKKLSENTEDEAKKAEYESEYTYYLNRAKNYVLLFDNPGDTIEDMWFRGKELNGSWTTGNYTDGVFDPFFWGSDYTETNAYNFAVTVPQDGQGLANLYGGRDALAAKLDTIFTTKGIYNGYGAKNGIGGIHEQKEAREVKLGQYGHSNQPSHHIPYMYIYAEQPWMTQMYVRDILDRSYAGSSFGHGYIGDEDNGEMSAWYVFSALGIYPLSVASGEYAIGSPLFEEATVNMDNGKSVTIKANNNSKENVYVQSMTVDGENYNKSFIEHERFVNADTIVFNMGEESNMDFGTGEEALPSSLTKGDEMPAISKDIIKTYSRVDEQRDTESTSPVQWSTLSGNISSLKTLINNNSSTEVLLDEEKTVITYSIPKGQEVILFTLTSGNTVREIVADPGEDPVAGTVEGPAEAKLYGAKDNGEWILLADYENIEFPWKQYTRPFKVDPDLVDSYQHYKLELTGGYTLSQIELMSNGTDKYVDISKDDLEQLISISESINQTEVPKKIVDSLENGIMVAKQVIANSDATAAEIVNAYKLLEVDIERPDNIKYAYTPIEAEDFDSGHAKIVIDGENIGGVQKDTWTMYRDVLFQADTNFFEIYYSAQSSDAGGTVEVYLDSMDGTPVFSIETPKTGTWSNYQLVDCTFDTPITGLYDVYLKFVGENTYVCNVDWFRFDASIAVTASVNGGNGEITPVDGETNYGGGFTFTITPDEAYKIKGISVNGVNVDISSLVLGEDGTYTYILENVTVTSNVVVTFKRAAAVEAIEIVSAPGKSSYWLGDVLNVTGGVIKITYADSFTEEIAITADMVSGFDSRKAGKQELTVTYDGITTKYSVTVSERKTLGFTSGGQGGGSNNNSKWTQTSEGWKYVKADGSRPINEWLLINNIWYYFDANSIMKASDWVYYKDKWYYLSASGAMIANDWIFTNNKWYYLSSDGSMSVGWVLWKGVWYYLNTANGEMLANTVTPDGYQVDSEGKWIQ